MFLVFSGRSHLLTNVFKRCSDDLRCSDIFSEDHKCWMWDFLQIFTRCSQDSPGFSQDVLMGLVSSVGLGGLVGLLGLVGLVGLLGLVGLVGLMSLVGL